MIQLARIGHVLLRVADIKRSKAFYQDVLGFRVVEEDPNHGNDCFMTLGNDFHNIDLVQHQDPESAQKPDKAQVGLVHIAFLVKRYEDLRDAYATLMDHGVEVDRAVDHVNQRSLYFNDPDGNRLEIYYEWPDSLTRFANNTRGDRDVVLEVSRPGEPIPAWLSETWPPKD
jgi:catechol-2,3-dioxygenase